MDFNTFDDEFNIQPIIKTKIELFLTELHVLFGTTQGRVFGKRMFGHSIERFLWDTSYNTDYIKSVTQQSIYDSCQSAKEFDYTVDFNVINGESRDIGVLDIIIKNFNEETVIANPRWLFK